MSKDLELVSQIDTLKQEFSTEKHELSVLRGENLELKKDLARVNKSLLAVTKQSDRSGVQTSLADKEPTQKSQARNEMLEMMT